MSVERNRHGWVNEVRESDAAVCWYSGEVNCVFSREERNALRDSDIWDMKRSFSADHGFSAFSNGRVGTDGSASEAANGCSVNCSVGDICRTRAR